MKRLTVLLVLLPAVLSAGAATVRETFDVRAYEPLVRRLRAFYPDETHEPCKDPRQLESARKIERELDRYCAAHPGYDALDVRQETYRLIRENFVPFLFPEHPFYFEAGINGGWTLNNGTVPGRNNWRLCKKVYFEEHLIDPVADRRRSARVRERMTVVGPYVDDQHHIAPFHTVFTKGFGGVRKEVEQALADCPANDPLARKEFETALQGLDTIHAMQLRFADEADRLLASGTLTAEGERNMRRVAASARRCPWEPPRDFYEAMNTLWFVREIMAYNEGLCIMTLGRPDAWLIDFYRRDVAAGRITAEEAKDLMVKFLLICDCHQSSDFTVRIHTNDQESEIPVSIGGQDKDGKPVYNELTRIILDAHLAFDLVFPKLHVRIFRDSPEEYLLKIAEMLMAGHAVFAFFNDEVIVPQFVRLGVPLERARDYSAMGCYDPYVDSWMDTDGDNYMSVARILELTINPDPAVEKKVGLRFDPIDGCKTYEEVQRTLYRNFMRMWRSTVSDYIRYGRVNWRRFPQPVYTMCLEGGIESRRDVTDGGVKLIPRMMTLAFLANTVDSLCAIRKVVFEDRAATLPEFLDACRANWQGEKNQRLRRLALDAPYWGDNSEASNALMKWWIDSVADELDGMVNDRGGPFVLSTWIYREFLHWSENARATPDGRYDGEQYAQGFAPSELRCDADATTILNAIGSLDHSRLYSSNANLSFDRSQMTPEAFVAIFRTVCRKHIHIFQPNCHSLEDLLDAQVHPERHRNIIIKVCGFSARFVSLDKTWQDEIIRRHRIKLRK